ncbi:MAG: hypothetical protein LBK61_04840 [Spirochaetaceae bacterium]|nr:hypothetical protein [Spirochaetaceae bacterium]
MAEDWGKNSVFGRIAGRYAWRNPANRARSSDGDSLRTRDKNLGGLP